MTLTEGLERTFDTAASNYENFRPGNPPQLPLYFDTGKIQELPFLQAGNSRTFPAVNSTRHALVQQFLNTHTLRTAVPERTIYIPIPREMPDLDRNTDFMLFPRFRTLPSCPLHILSPYLFRRHCIS